MNKTFVYIGIIIIFVLTAMLIVWYLLAYRENSYYQQQGTLLNEKIETFRRIEKKLPNDFNELRIEEPMNEGPYYKKIDSGTYVVYFNIGFDNTIIYYSNTKEW